VKVNGEIISTIASSGGGTVFALLKNRQRCKFDTAPTASTRFTVRSRQSPSPFEIRDDHCSHAEIFGWPFH
jgi:hypothetical protein